MSSVQTCGKLNREADHKPSPPNEEIRTAIPIRAKKIDYRANRVRTELMLVALHSGVTY